MWFWTCTHWPSLWWPVCSGCQVDVIVIDENRVIDQTLKVSLCWQLLYWPTFTSSRWLNTSLPSFIKQDIFICLRVVVVIVCIMVIVSKCWFTMCRKRICLSFVYVLCVFHWDSSSKCVKNTFTNELNNMRKRKEKNNNNRNGQIHQKVLCYTYLNTCLSNISKI